MRCYTKDSLKLHIREEHKQNIKDVATELRNQLTEQNVKLAIDCVGLLGAFLDECGVVPRLNNDEEKKCDICGNDLPKKSYYFRCESCRKTARFEKATKIKYSDYKVPMFYDEQSDQYFDSYEDMLEYYENNLCEGEELVLPKYVFGCKENIFKINIENAVESAIEDMYDDFDDIVDLRQLHDFVKEWNQKQTAKSYYQDNSVIIIFD